MIFSIVSWTSIPSASFFGSDFILLFTSEWHLAFEAYGTRTDFFWGGFHVWLKPMLLRLLLLFSSTSSIKLLSRTRVRIYNRNIATGAGIDFGTWLFWFFSAYTYSITDWGNPDKFQFLVWWERLFCYRYRFVEGLFPFFWLPCVGV